MKWPAGAAAAFALLLLGMLGLESTRPLAPLDRAAGTRIVAGTERPTAPLAPPPNVGAPATIDAPTTGTITAAPNTDSEAIDALFDGQSRDPTWAPGAEALIRSQMPGATNVRCAEFMCRIAIPLPDRPGSPDEQADAATRDWPAGLSYNRLTATLGSDGAKPMLIFYATKAADGRETATDG